MDATAPLDTRFCVGDRVRWGKRGLTGEVIEVHAAFLRVRYQPPGVRRATVLVRSDDKPRRIEEEA